jgi:hypothetical protein
LESVPGIPIQKEQCTMYIGIHRIHILISNFLVECSWNSIAKRAAYNVHCNSYTPHYHLRFSWRVFLGTLWHLIRLRSEKNKSGLQAPYLML